MARWAKWVINMAVQGTPITGENWTTLGNGVLPTTMWQMTLEWFIFMGLYWYLENILSVGHGTAKGWCFCLESCRNGGDAAAVKTIEADGPPPHADIAPASMSAKYEYGARGDMPPVSLTWHQGDNKPEIWRENEDIQKFKSGVCFIGDKGIIVSDYRKHALLPEKDFKDFEKPAPWIAPSLGHHAEWVHACKTGAPTTCDFAYSGPLTEANHLGNVAFRAAKKLEWDAKNMKIPNAPDAERFLGREYRKGWKLE